MNIYDNKVAIITGGGSGIGREIALFLAKKNARVVIVDKVAISAEETKNQIVEFGGYCQVFNSDVSNLKEVDNFINSVYEKCGHIDFLFNNAGISFNGEFSDISLEYWKQVIDVNLLGVVYGCHCVYPIMKKQGFGHIINTASLAGLIPGGLTTCYSASKHAVVGFSQTLRSEAKLYGIKVTTLCPGYIRTNIQNTTPNLSSFMNSPKNIEMEKKMKFKTPDICINHIMKGISKNKSIVISPATHKLYWILYRIFPSFIPFMFSNIINHMKKNV